MNTLVNTSWTGTMSNYLGIKRQVTVKFNTNGQGEVDPMDLTYNYTQDIRDGQVAQFNATPSSQGMIDHGIGFLANNVLSGTFTIETVVWGFILSPA